MDPLSDVLSLLKPRSYAFRGLDAGGRWSMAFPPSLGLNCYALHAGGCWLVLEGTPSALHLTAGDCVLLPRGRPFRLCSDLDVAPVDAVALLLTVEAGGVVRIGGGGACSGVGGFFAFDSPHADLLLALLPPVVHVRKEADRAALRGSVQRLMQELRDPQPGGALIAEHLAQMLLIQALRLHLAEQPGEGPGWLFALADKPMSLAIAAMHADPARRWTLRALAETAGLSRSSFAARFKATVGEPAMEYLTRWRMLLASDRLANAGASVPATAAAVGYASESAFGVAFKRVIGRSPRRFARGSR